MTGPEKIVVGAVYDGMKVGLLRQRQHEAAGDHQGFLNGNGENDWIQIMQYRPTARPHERLAVEATSAELLDIT
jgi:hypothetical protein